MRKITILPIKIYVRYFLRQLFLIVVLLTFFLGIYWFILNRNDIVRPSLFSKTEFLGYLDSITASELKHGQKNTKELNLVICGITRDNANSLIKIIPYLEQTGALFKDYRIIIFENDSKDGTTQILKQWQSLNKKVRIESKNYLNRKRPNIEFLARARNHYLAILRNNPEYQDFDILMVVDLDMDYGWDLRGILHTFNHIEQWEGVCSNGVFKQSGNMWDTFAFRKISPPPAVIRKPEYWQDFIEQQKITYTPEQGLIPVHSCFGGLAFYKRSYIETCSYESIDGDCEHIPFHACLIANQGRMLMNAAQVIRYSHYH